MSIKKNLPEQILEPTEALGSGVQSADPTSKANPTVVPATMPKTGIGAVVTWVNVSRKVQELQKEARNIRTVPLASIDPNPWAHGSVSDAQVPEALARRQEAPSQPEPIVVRINPDNAARFQIAFGVSDWRSQQELKVRQVDAFIGEFTDTEMAMLAKFGLLQRD